MSMTFKKPKKKGGGAKTKDKVILIREREDSEDDVDDLDVSGSGVKDDVGVNPSFFPIALSC